MTRHRREPHHAAVARRVRAQPCLFVGSEQLLQNLDHRPIGDPIPVVEPPALHHGRIGRCPELRRQTRLTHTRRAQDGKQLAGAIRPCLLETVGHPPQLTAAPNHRRIDAAAERRSAPTHPQQTERASGSTSTASRTSASVSAPTRISPGGAACSRRAATLTASPVARRSSVPVTTSPVFTPIRSASLVP